MNDNTGMSPLESAFHASAERHERFWIFGVLVMLVLLTIGTMFYVVHDYGLVTSTHSYATDPQAPPREAAFQDGKVVRTGPNAYAVYMVGRAWHWSPDVIHVPEGAEITFYVTSADVLHGFEIQGTPVNLTAVPGVVGTVKYTFHHTGLFRIICNEYCGMFHHAMVARIIVDPAGTP
ncbi:cytochrome c oxidase subunit 2 [Gluconacetobacter liquefaciens]|uniref:Cytochrome C oxidase subunit II n=1 Tax=Gluconacetobacter liquefaciens TaxID=89584 RepID=A0A370G8P3_GLULI|nr:cytochrome C oxidase subunit II [Gluconacetobacter liquefaciens]MBB2185699.1 cytochrome C oxidase subunit II [Gluconacetobacter liquefaciens]RDI39506.1 cytochrome c oxidase subunit 2 [Gluconacetobacter liquefaciens]GBQ94777.1 cytochrome c oxidase subunit II [Gluconacetobacter liquefaciens NRIC 0522]GEB36146.1 cytochrome c oxidase subunit 2 [Gluconacetobacter liquefaciens]